jgi:hypothetical protein
LFITPTSDNSASEDTLFHYTTAAGLHGIISSNTIWSTAYHCSNDGSELMHSTGVISDMVNAELREPKYASDARLNLINNKGQPGQLAQLGATLEKQIFKIFTSNYELFITSFCKHNKAQSVDGLLSQWRGYGPDGGYAIAFDIRKLRQLVLKAKKECSKDYELADVNYSKNKSAPRESLTELEAATKIASLLAPNHIPPPNLHSQDIEALVNIALNVSTDGSEIPLGLAADERLSGWINTEMSKYISYFTFQKSDGFAEEKGIRLALLSPKNQDAQEHRLMLQFFDRSGMLVPYVEFPRDLKISECIDAIIVGPAERMSDRCRSTKSLLHRHAINASVRPSGIPFIRGNK